MPVVHAIPMLLAILVGLVLGLVAWGFVRVEGSRVGEGPISTRGEILIGLLILSAFALGVFVTYVVLGASF